MSSTVCLTANTFYYPEGGGHLWVYLNWALGFKALGFRVVWLEGVVQSTPPQEIDRLTACLKSSLKPYGLDESVALCGWDGEELSGGETQNFLSLEEAVAADILVDPGYHFSENVVSRFRRSVLIDIDPGLLQIWLSQGEIELARHDCYYTIGETVSRPDSRFPDAGYEWHYTPPCVSVEHWPTVGAPADSPFTTVSHWNEKGLWIEFGDELYDNNKRQGFMPYLTLPRRTSQRLELALALVPGAEDSDRRMLEENGWSTQNSYEVAATPAAYQAYIQRSRGEFSCVKPSCVRLQNAWVSDRTLCYLATGKPAVVEHTGPSRFLPDAEGLLRFRTIEEAARCIEMASDDYELHSRSARKLAEEHFDARKVAANLLARV
jgi:hypothetical protein